MTNKRHHALSKNCFESILDAAGEPIFVKNSDLEFVLANKAYCELVNLPREKIIGNELSIVLPTHETQKLNEIDELVLEYGMAFSTEWIINLDGQESRTFFVKKTRYTDDAGIHFVVAVLHEITEQKQNEKIITEKNLELLNMNIAKDKFFGIIAHDLRGPFNGFLGLTEYMNESLNTLSFDELHNIVHSLKNSAVSVFNLLENLLAWANFQNRLTIFNPVLIDLCAQTKIDVDILLDVANKKWIEISIQIPSDIQIVFDVNMYRSIIHNIVTNAIKFTNKRGSVIISAKIEKSFAHITIKDTGVGMSAKVIENIFVVDKDTRRIGTDGEASFGLGLVLCNEFIHNYGGKLWIESEEGIGSEFHFILPLFVK